MRSRIRFEDSFDPLGFISKVFKGTLESDRVGTIREAKYVRLDGVGYAYEALDNTVRYPYEDLDNTVRIHHKNLVGLKRKLKKQL